METAIIITAWIFSTTALMVSSFSLYFMLKDKDIEIKDKYEQWRDPVTGLLKAKKRDKL